jgi:hypothetical protein
MLTALVPLRLIPGLTLRRLLESQFLVSFAANAFAFNTLNNANKNILFADFIFFLVDMRPL